MTQLSYNNDPEFKARFVAELHRHREADEVAQGTYGEFLDGNWKGCAVGCSIRSLDRLDGKAHGEFGDHAYLAERLQVPQFLTRLEDRIFEGLPTDVALDWPVRFGAAIPIGRDLSGVWPRFALWLLSDEQFGVRRHAKSDTSRAAIDGVIELFKHQVAGEPVTREAWQAARKKAHASANAAAYDAAAYAAAYDASANANANARKSWYVAAADKLISLLESA